MGAAAIPAVMVLFGLPVIWFVADFMLFIRHAPFRVSSNGVEPSRRNRRVVRIGRLSTVRHLGISASSTSAEWYVVSGSDGAVPVNNKHSHAEDLEPRPAPPV
jgi:hypothetical protein